MNEKQLKMDIAVILSESLYNHKNKSRQTSVDGKIAYERLLEYLATKEK